MYMADMAELFHPLALCVWADEEAAQKRAAIFDVAKRVQLKTDESIWNSYHDKMQ